MHSLYMVGNVAGEIMMNYDGGTAYVFTLTLNTYISIKSQCRILKVQQG